MEHTTLGETGLEVSRICLGTWQFSGQWSTVDEDQARATVRRARELGIDFYDTARAYGFGRSERILGEALRKELDGDRASVTVATKGGLRPVGGRQVDRDSSPERLRQELGESLEDLGVDHVDLFQVHWPDHDTPFREVGEALAALREEGLARHVGVSNYSADQLAAVQRAVSLDTLQPPYSMLRREAEASILPYCRREGIGVLAYGPLAHGLLTGKYDADATFPDDDWRAHNPWFQGEVLARNVEVVDRLEAVAEDVGATVTQLAVAWVLDHPAVDVAIVGARRPGHVEGVAPAAGLELDPGTRERIEGILEDAVGIGGATPETG